MSIRKIRFSYGLIKATGEFVVNVAPIELAQQALFCGRRSGSEVDKFAATGLTPLAAREVRPPIIEECIAHLECRVVDDIEIGDHNLLVAQVLAAYARKEALHAEGSYDLSRARPLLHVGRNRFSHPARETIEPELD
jgi:flavin reductase (DIM6/NTAB) family NADH-FMN oxidoreductase RutF